MSLAIAFDWYREFDARVRLRELRRLLPNYNPQTARVLQAEDAWRIMERGHGDV